MARGVTEQDVFEAADALLARNKRPTIERVRQELGRGSPNTINPFLDSWWTALGKRVGGVQANSLPPALLQATTRFYDEIRAQAVNEAADALAEQQRLAEEARQALAASQMAMITEKAGLQSTIEALRSELGRLNTTNQALTLQVAHQQVDLENALDKASQAAEALERVQDEQQRAAAAAKAELERVREQWQGNEKHWLGEIEHLREEAKRLRGEQDRTQKASQARIHDLEQQLSAGAKERAALRVAHDTGQRDLAKEREKRSFAEGALAANRRRREEGSPAVRPRRARPAAKR